MTFGTKSYDMDVGLAAKPQTREATEVTSLGDTFKRFIPGALTEDDELTITIYDPGLENRPKTSDAPAALSFAVVLSNGEDADLDANFSYVKAIVTKVSPPSQEGKGERLATIDVTFRPNGEQSGGTQSGGTQSGGTQSGGNG